MSHPNPSLRLQDNTSTCLANDPRPPANWLEVVSEMILRGYLPDWEIDFDTGLVLRHGQPISEPA